MAENADNMMAENMTTADTNQELCDRNLLAFLTFDYLCLVSSRLGIKRCYLFCHDSINRVFS